MLACELFTRKSRLDCFPAAFSLAASYSLNVLFDLLPFLDSGSCSSLVFFEVSFELALALERVTELSEMAAPSFLAAG